jgi:DNA polymerase-3 subunit delta
MNIIEAIESTPMMFGNSLIEIYSKKLFTRGQTQDEKLLNRLIEDIKTLPENLYVIFVCIFEKDSDKKADSAKKLYKIIKETGEIEEYKAALFYETDKIALRAVSMAKTKKLELNKQDSDFLVECVGMDVRRIDSELEKIKTYIFPDTKITKNIIKELSQDSENAFKVLDFWIENDKKNAILELKKLLFKEPSQKVLALFQTMTKKWLRTKLEAEYSSYQEIASILKANPYKIKMDLEKLKKVSANQLVEFRKRLNKAEFDIKSGKYDDITALEVAFLL